MENQRAHIKLSITVKKMSVSKISNTFRPQRQGCKVMQVGAGPPGRCMAASKNSHGTAVFLAHLSLKGQGDSPSPYIKLQVLQGKVICPI